MDSAWTWIVRTALGRPIGAATAPCSVAERSRVADHHRECGSRIGAESRKNRPWLRALLTLTPFYLPAAYGPLAAHSGRLFTFYGRSDETTTFEGGTLLLPVAEKRCRSVPSNDETENFARQESSGITAERRGDEASQGGRAGFARGDTRNGITRNKKASPRKFERFSVRVLVPWRYVWVTPPYRG